jgi:hypothetical protein
MSWAMQILPSFKDSQETKTLSSMFNTATIKGNLR